MSQRGRLRIYLGAAPGVGKTFAMLSEGHRRAERGTDVVIAYVEDHGRSHTAELTEGLETVPRKDVSYRGATFSEMDLDAVLVRRPEQALVDELAHTNAPGSRNEKRWQDVEILLDAGIDVITTLNVQHLESVNDVVESITGIVQRETVPDDVVRRAEQIELVDMTPEALRRRMAHGNIYAPDKVDAALSNYFRPGNLAALRELALLWLADRVDEGLRRYRRDHEIESTWETRERVVVALTGGPEGPTLIRRASRVASRGGAELLAVHVARADGLSRPEQDGLREQRELVASLGGTFHVVEGDDVAEALLSFARAEDATQLVIGDTRRAWRGPFALNVGDRVIRSSGPIDVHVVTHDFAGGGARRAKGESRLSSKRRVAGFSLGALLLALLTFALVHNRSSFDLTSDLLLYLAVTVIAAAVGGLWPGVAAALAASLLANYYFVPPIHTFTIASLNNVLAVVVFVAIAILVALVVDHSARRSQQAARLSSEAALLAELSSGVLRGRGSTDDLLALAQATFSLESVALCEGTGSRRRILAHAGDIGDGMFDSEIPVAPGRTVALRGRPANAEQQRLLVAFASQIALAWATAELQTKAADAAVLAETDRTRAALLAAVSHDLRTPLAAATAALGTLAAPELNLSDTDRHDLVESARRSISRLTRLVENLLDLSRLQAGALSVQMETVDVSDVVASVLDELAPVSDDVSVLLPDDLPFVRGDEVLLERVLVNVLANALRHCPDGVAPRLSASSANGRVELRVIDQGPGIATGDRERIFTAFQRLDDTSPGGVGLGLALSKGLCEAMDATLEPEETPGGGLTMVISLGALSDPAWEARS